jgi:drug/metabolite transporter (DMT)-like permease
MTQYYIVAIICVFVIALGQILFKLSADSWRHTGTIFDPKTILMLFVAFAFYGLSSIAWVWLLQKIELGRVYPLMALAFILVPIGSYLFFDERFQPQYFLGVAFIVVGIVITMKA